MKGHLVQNQSGNGDYTLWFDLRIDSENIYLRVIYPRNIPCPAVAYVTGQRLLVS